MKRSRKFLIFILVLLAINSLFFIAWYGLNLEDKVRDLVEREAGKALKGRMQIRDFSISDQQVFAEKISFTAADSSLSFEVRSARIRFNLLKFIFSGFKIRNILNRVEIDRADVSYHYRHRPGIKKPPRKLEIPDLTTYFNELRVSDSSIKIDLALPLKIGEPDTLVVQEALTGININVINSDVSNLSCKANSANKGNLKAWAILDRGRLASASAEISNYVPQSVYHPQIQDFSTELNLVLAAAQQEPNGKVSFEAKSIIWNTQALLFKRYPLQIPYLTIQTDGQRLSADLARSTLGSSSAAGRLGLSGLNGKPRAEDGQLELDLDLGMFIPELEGRIAASLNASGSLTDPQLSLNASSPRVSYKEFNAENLNLSADYSNDELSFSLPGARWDNQTVTLDGVVDVPQRRATAQLVTQPVSLSRDELKIDAALTLELGLHSALPEAKVNFARLHLAKGDLDLPVLAGYMNLFPLITEKQKNYYVDLDLDDGNGTRLSLIGDILDRDLLLDAEFENLAPAELFPVSLLSQINPLLSGKISSFMAKDKLVVSSQLDLQLNGALNYQTSLELKGSYDLTAKEGTAILDAGPGSLNGQPLELELIAQLLDRDVILHSLRLNDQFNLQGDLALDDLADFSCELSLRDLNSAQLTSYFPFLKLPQLNGINLDASFNRDGDRYLDAKFRLEEFQVSGIRPLSLNLDLRGPPEQIAISGGIANQARRLVELNGALDIPEGVDLRLNAQAYDLQAADVIVSNLASGAADVDLSFAFTDILTSERDMSLLGQISSPEFSIPDVLDLSDILIRVAQTENVLIVDTLAVTSLQYGSVHGSGALDYNLFTNSFLEGEHLLDLTVEANIFDWLAANLDLVNAASGKARLNCSLKTYEDQLMVQAGRLDIAEGRLVLKDQPEPIRDINIQADFADNRVLLRNFSCLSGNGRLTVQNSFEEDDSEHLKLGFLDWGILSLRIDQPGALVQIPLVTTSRNLSNVVLQGQNSEYATIRGPLDDMRISAEVLVYNAEALFPPNTDNLLSLIYSFRSALSKPDIAPPDPVPLPFRLDLMIRMMDNIRYATYPTNFRMQPGGFLHIVYDGLNWHAREANFLSEQGSIDFFGTVFNTESLNIRIIEDQDLIDIKGSFTRRAADGTVITLSVNTDPDTAKPIFDRLTFSLTSDNPEDRTVSNILSRLRYSSSSEELSATQRGSLLQDEALNLISDNLNTSLISPFLYPLENTIRRWLRLDDFSINAGFIQNLFTEYSNNPSQLAEYTNMDQFMSDITQFSSSILLNNLSFSFSKYLGRRFFLDYTLTLQEATDLQNNTQIVVSHDTSLRVFLPLQLRLAYTFIYEPQIDKLSHELMLQRSFRFWGL